MARQEAPPFPRGATLFAGSPPDGTSDQNMCGKEWIFEDVTYGTNQYVHVRAVRNTGSFTLSPGRVCQFDPSYPMNAINGYVDVTAQPGVVLDELLVNGLVANDIGYAIMEGPALVWTPLDGGADNVIGFLDPVAAVTAATSGATTAGRVATVAAATTNTRDALLNVIGRAISAATTANTNKQVLVDVQRLF